MRKKETKKSRIMAVGLCMMMTALFAMSMLMFIAPEASAGELGIEINTGKAGTANVAVTPGTAAYTYLQLTNANTSVSMTVDVSYSSVGTGWSVSIMNDTNVTQTSFTVAASSTTNVTIQIMATTDATILQGGDSDVIYINASEGTRGLTDYQPITVTCANIYKLSHYMLDISSAKIYTDTISTNAGENAGFIVFVKNTGNVVMDTTYNLNTSVLPANWTAEIVDDFLTPAIISGHSGLRPNEVDSYVVRIKPDLGETSGSYGVVKSVAQVNGQPSATITLANLTMNTTVYGTTYVAPQWSMTDNSSAVAVGGSVLMTATVTNSNIVAMDTVFTVSSPQDVLGSDLTGWTVTVWLDDGATENSWDSYTNTTNSDSLLATPGNPSAPVSIAAGQAERVWIMVNTTSTVNEQTKARIILTATFTSIIDKSATLESTSETPAKATTNETVTGAEEEPTGIYATYWGYPMYYYIVGLVSAAIIAAAIYVVWSKKRAS